jgi:RNA polymerase sigma-70 factor, ECF subfamily
VSYKRAGEKLCSRRLRDIAKLSQEDVRQLYAQHGAVLLAYACLFVADRSIAEDVLHGVFLKLLTSNLTTPDHPRAYLYRAIRNAALNANRAAAREVEFDGENPWFVAPSGEQADASMLEVALRELPQEQREVIVMRIWGDMTTEEVAAVLEISPNTVASRYRYGLAKLRQKMLSPTRR